MLNVFISDLGQYNAGVLTGEWHDLESHDGRESAHNAVVSIMQADDGEYFISDFESDHIYVDSYMPIDTLLNIGEQFEAHNMDTEQLLETIHASDLDTFSHLMLTPMEDFDDAMQHESPMDLANKCYFGDFKPTDDHFTLDGYANLSSMSASDYHDLIQDSHKDVVKHWLSLCHDIHL